MEHTHTQANHPFVSCQNRFPAASSPAFPIPFCPSRRPSFVHVARVFFCLVHFKDASSSSASIRVVIPPSLLPAKSSHHSSKFHLVVVAEVTFLAGFFFPQSVIEKDEGWWVEWHHPIPQTLQPLISHIIPPKKEESGPFLALDGWTEAMPDGIACLCVGTAEWRFGSWATKELLPIPHKSANVVVWECHPPPHYVFPEIHLHIFVGCVLQSKCKQKNRHETNQQEINNQLRRIR